MWVENYTWCCNNRWIRFVFTIFLNLHIEIQIFIIYFQIYLCIIVIVHSTKNSGTFHYDPVLTGKWAQTLLAWFRFVVVDVNTRLRLGKFIKHSVSHGRVCSKSIICHFPGDIASVTWPRWFQVWKYLFYYHRWIGAENSRNSMCRMLGLSPGR